MYNVTVLEPNGARTAQKYDDYKEAVRKAKALSADNAQNLIEIERETDGCVCWSSEDGDEIKRYTELTAEEYLTMPLGFKGVSDKPSIYFDMDGTTCYWYYDAKGYRYPDEVLDPKNHYYRDLEPHPFMIALAKRLVDLGYDVGIISAADKNVLRDKYEWLKRNMPFIDEKNICFCPIGTDKNNYVKGNANKSILIDDYKANLKQWQGKPMKAINSINSEDPTMYCINGNWAEQAIGTEHEKSRWDAVMETAEDYVISAIGSPELWKGNEENITSPFLGYHEFTYNGKPAIISTVPVHNHHYETVVIDTTTKDEIFAINSSTAIEAFAAHKIAVERFNLILEGQENDGKVTGQGGMIHGKVNEKTQDSERFHHFPAYDDERVQALNEYCEFYKPKNIIREGENIKEVINKLTPSEVNELYEKLEWEAARKLTYSYIINDESVPKPERVPIAFGGAQYIMIDEEGNEKVTTDKSVAENFAEISATHTYKIEDAITHSYNFPEIAELRRQIDAVYEFENNNVQYVNTITVWYDDLNMPLIDYTNGGTTEKIQAAYHKIQQILGNEPVAPFNEKFSRFTFEEDEQVKTAIVNDELQISIVLEGINNNYISPQCFSFELYDLACRCESGDNSFSARDAVIERINSHYLNKITPVCIVKQDINKPIEDMPVELWLECEVYGKTIKAKVNLSDDERVNLQSELNAHLAVTQHESIRSIVKDEIKAWSKNKEEQNQKE